MLRRRIGWLVAICICFIFVGNVCALAEINIPDATNEFYVNDFASVFTESSKAKLINDAVNLANNSDGIQVVVSTVKTLGGHTVEEYANKMYNKYGIGKDDKGILILLATEDRQIRLEVGRGLEGDITDSKAGKLLDKHAIPYLKKNEFEKGIVSLQEAVVKYISDNVVAVDNQVDNSMPAVSDIASDSNQVENRMPIVSDVANKEMVAPEASNGVNAFPRWLVWVLVGLAITGLAIMLALLILKRVEIKSLKEKISDLKSSNSDLRYYNERSMLRLTKQHETEIESLNLKNEALSQRLDEANDRIATLTTSCTSLGKEIKNWEATYSRVRKLHPKIDTEMDVLLKEEQRQKDMQLAAEVDEAVSKVIGLNPSKDIVEEIEEVTDMYSKLNARQRQLLKSDMLKLDTLYKDSVALREQFLKKQQEEANKRAASQSEEEINRVISSISIAKAKDLKKLEDARRSYDRLSRGALQYFNSALITNLDEMIRKAREDKRRIEEEERKKEEERRRREEERRRREEKERRRRMQSFSHSSSSYSSSSFSSSHHSGFGGFSGGGGASRGF